MVSKSQNITHLTFNFNSSLIARLHSETRESRRVRGRGHQERRRGGGWPCESQWRGRKVADSESGCSSSHTLCAQWTEHCKSGPKLSCTLVRSLSPQGLDEWSPSRQRVSTSQRKFQEPAQHSKNSLLSLPDSLSLHLRLQLLISAQVVALFSAQQSWPKFRADKGAGQR